MHYSGKPRDIQLSGENFRMNLKCTMTYTGELNMTFSQILNAHVPLFKF